MDAPALHPGERALQARLGMSERLDAVGRSVVRDHLPGQHREFFARLPTLLLGMQDDAGQPWATILHGPVGFVSSPDEHTLSVHAKPDADDPAAPCLLDGAAVGLLGLEPQTRRRNRANGRVRSVGAEGFDVTVSQSFGNCPKYIFGRVPETIGRQPLAAQRLDAALDPESIALLRRADTLFIASASAARPGGARADGVDVSHRGGRAGFIGVDATFSGLRLTLPDYTGNFFFNTLGNLLLWPAAGLLVPDYDTGTLLQIAATASIEHEGARLAAFPGAQRLLNLTVLSGWRRPGALPLRWSEAQMPPQFAT